MARPVHPRSKSAPDVRRLMARLSSQHPNADTELHFENPYQLLVATILSAQCTDERVNQVTPALFRRYPDARALSRATTDELEPQIQSTGFFRAKSRALLGMAIDVVARHGGEIPRTMEELVGLPGVGRKTANVVLGHALGVPGLPVDRHVLRVANRIGIARSEDPEVVEQQLNAALPPSEWTRASDTLILHGRRICKPRPLCDRCVVRDDCDYYQTMQGLVTGTARALQRSGAGRAKAPEPASRSARASSRRGRPRAKPRVAAAPRHARRDGANPTERAASGPSFAPRRGAKPRGTGGGGGAPPQRKK